MQRNTAARIWVVASMIYGILLAILATMDASNIALVAMIGGGIIAIGWVVIGMMKPVDSQPSPSRSDPA